MKALAEQARIAKMVQSVLDWIPNRDLRPGYTYWNSAKAGFNSVYQSELEEVCELVNIELEGKGFVTTSNGELFYSPLP